MEQISGDIRVGALPAVSVPGRLAGKSARYGVGEVIKLSPQQSLPLGGGPVYWRLVTPAGVGTVTNEPLSGAGSYTAGDITLAQLQAGKLTYDATLELVNNRGSVLAKVKLTIVAPKNCGLLKLGPKHEQGSANSGFWGQLAIGEKDVSFMNIEVKETRGTISATGVFASFNGTIHADSTAWVTASKVTSQGTLMNAADNVWSPAVAPDGGWKPDNHSLANMEAGKMEWDIAWMYRLRGSTSATGLQFGKAWHKSIAWKNGKMTTEKGGASHTASIGDATENYADVCPLALL